MNHLSRRRVHLDRISWLWALWLLQGRQTTAVCSTIRPIASFGEAAHLSGQRMQLHRKLQLRYRLDIPRCRLTSVHGRMASLTRHVGHTAVPTIVLEDPASRRPVKRHWTRRVHRMLHALECAR